MINKMKKGINIYIEKNLAQELDEFNIDKIEIKDKLEIFLMKKLEMPENRRAISVRKLAKEYNEETGKSISKSTVHKYIRKRMGFRYLKSTIKTKIILQKNNILMSLTFLKIISRCIKFNMNILYCDETSIQNQSNNIQAWRKSNEVIYEDIPKKEKLNLILTVSKDDVIYFELNEDNTNQDNFLIYIKNLLEAIKKKLISEKFVIVLDNYSGHKTPKLMEYYLNNKINVLFNSPYLSNFNAVELAFRNLKKAFYKKNYKNIDEIKTELVNILISDKFKKGLLKNYSDTLKEYIEFFEKEKDRDINK